MTLFYPSFLQGSIKKARFYKNNIFLQLGMIYGMVIKRFQLHTQKKRYGNGYGNEP